MLPHFKRALTGISSQVPHLQLRPVHALWTLRRIRFKIGSRLVQNLEAIGPKFWLETSYKVPVVRSIWWINPLRLSCERRHAYVHVLTGLPQQWLFGTKALDSRSNMQAIITSACTIALEACRLMQRRFRFITNHCNDHARFEHPDFLRPCLPFLKANVLLAVELTETRAPMWTSSLGDSPS